MKYLSILLVFSCNFLMGNLAAQDEEFGLASYYSDDFQGRDTAYGDTYDKNEMTCAHKRYPYGTRVRVTRLDNNKSVVVKVIDKGPFIKGRIIDLSRRAAEQLGILDMGSVRVKVEKITTSEKKEPSILDKPVEEIKLPSQPSPEAYEEEAPSITKEKAAAPVVARSTQEKPQRTQSKIQESKDRRQLVGDDFTPYGLYKIVLEKPEQQGYGVQVASLSNFENVLKKVASLQAKWFDNILLSMEAGTDGNKQYKVILGPFATQKEAQYYQASMKSRYNITGFVIDLTGLKY